MIVKTAQYNTAVTVQQRGFPDLFPFLYQRGQDVLSTYHEPQRSSASPRTVQFLCVFVPVAAQRARSRF